MIIVTHILVSGTITVAALAAGRGNNKIQVVLQNCSSFTNCISEIIHKKIILMHNLTECIIYNLMYHLIEIIFQKHQKVYGNAIEMNQLWMMLALFLIGNSAPLKLKQTITGSTGNYGTKAVQIMVPLKYLSNF